MNFAIKEGTSCIAMPYVPFLLNGLIATKQPHCFALRLWTGSFLWVETPLGTGSASPWSTTPAPNILPSTYKMLDPWNKGLLIG